MPLPPHRLRREALEGRAVPALFTVLNTDDSGPGSLRQAILDANATDEADTIEFDPGVTGTITLTGGELTITRDLTVSGPGAGVLAVSGNDASRVFKVDDGDGTTARAVAITGLTVTDGYDGTYDGGGGVFNAEALTLTGVTASGNTAYDVGGGVLNAGALTLTGSTVSGNTAPFGGGVYNRGTLALTDSTVSGNTGRGGGLSNSGTATLTGSTVSDNTAPAGGGGGIDNRGTLALTGSTVSGNTSNRDLTNSGGLYNSGTATLTGCTVSGNTGGIGGGVLNTGTLALTDSTVSGNTARVGGGGVRNSGTATVTGSTVSGNTALTGGGVDNGLGTLTLTNSTVSGNTATGSGGGLFNRSDFTGRVARATVAGVTVAGNAAPSGGGIANQLNGELTLANTVVADSTSGGDVARSGEAGEVLTLGGVNLVEDGSVAGAGVINLDPLLGPLAGNGGPTETHLLPPGSPARRAGDPAAVPADALDADGDGDTSEPVPYDQRGAGFPRLTDGRVDLGAVQTPRAAGLAVNRGQAQRSYVRYLDVTLDSAAEASALTDLSRLRLVRRDLDGNNPVTVALDSGMVSAAGSVLTLDFGPQGLGGNRNAVAADGYYTLEMDLDGDGTHETGRSFLRLLGDTNGDRQVDQADADRIAAGLGLPYDPELDVNGDGVVNGSDRLLAHRHRGRFLAPGLPLDG